MSEIVIVQCQSITCKALQPDSKAMRCFSCGAPLQIWAYAEWVRQCNNEQKQQFPKGA